MSDSLNIDNEMAEILSPDSNLSILKKDTDECRLNSSISLFKLVNNIKYRYPNIFSAFDKFPLLPADQIGSLIDQTASYLDGLMDTNCFSLKANYKRFGLNSVFSIFVLSRMKNKEVSNVLRLKILVKLIKHYLQGEEGVKYLGKMSYNSYSNITREKTKNLFFAGVTPSIMKGKMQTIFNDHLIKIITAIFNPQSNHPRFLSFFNDKIYFLFSLQHRKYMIVNDHLKLNFTFKNDFVLHFLKDVFDVAVQRPFVFLTVLF